MNWSALLEFAPIVLEDGRKLVTLADARDYLIDHPNHTVAGALLKAAERPNQFTLHCARQAVSRAVHGVAGPEKRERKPTWKDRRKLRQRP